MDFEMPELPDFEWSFNMAAIGILRNARLTGTFGIVGILPSHFDRTPTNQAK